MNPKLTKKQKNSMFFVGTYNEQELKDNKDKKDFKELEKEKGITLYGIMEIRKGANGTMLLDSYAMTKEQYINSNLI